MNTRVGSGSEQEYIVISFPHCINKSIWSPRVMESSKSKHILLLQSFPSSCWSGIDRGQRYVLIIHFYVESGQKMIQFNIQFKIESKIFIQWIIHSIFSQKYRFNELFIQYSVRNIDSKFYSKNWIKTIQIYVIKPTQWKPAKRERFP